MFNIINNIVGFAWIKNETLRKTVRLAFNVGLVIVAAQPGFAPVLAVIGITPGPEAQAVAGAVGIIAEAVRGLATPKAPK